MNSIIQLFHNETSTFTYIIFDEKTREAAIIDSVRGETDSYIDVIDSNNLKLKYILETHIHADHATDAANLRKALGAEIAFHSNANTTCQDIYLKDGDVLMLGETSITSIETLGHTDTCISYYFKNAVFTGDSLLINGSGRTDFQAGCAKTLYSSIKRLYKVLPEETIVYPGHDYRSKTKSTIGAELSNNERINQSTSEEEFVDTMSNLSLPKPKWINMAVPANLVCGEY